MSKKAIYGTEAERLFVQENYTISEIVAKLRLSEKTIRNWKQDGDWDNKKKQFLTSKMSFHEELYDFVRTLMQSLREDLNAGRKIDTGRMYAFTQLCSKLTNVKKYEDAKGKAAGTEPPATREEIFDLIQKALTGEE
ncbi:MAG: phage terminase small subunit-related protein [bacterium]